MATQQEQQISRDLAKLIEASRPIRRISNGKAITDYGNGLIVSLPLHGSNIERSTSISQK